MHGKNVEFWNLIPRKFSIWRGKILKICKNITFMMQFLTIFQGFFSFFPALLVSISRLTCTYLLMTNIEYSYKDRTYSLFSCAQLWAVIYQWQVLCIGTCSVVARSHPLIRSWPSMVSMGLTFSSLYMEIKQDINVTIQGSMLRYRSLFI